MRRTKGLCAYCGKTGVDLEREHVIPRCLYPAGRGYSSSQRITVLACASCNRGWSDDEAHFRNVLLVAGEANRAVNELWVNKAKPSFRKSDGHARVAALFEQLKPVIIEDKQRWIIYPGKDERVIRVIRKIIRGLSHFHGVESAIQDDRIWADVLTFAVPDEWMNSVTFHQREPEIVRYWYEACDDSEFSSVWLLTFFERRTFLARVNRVNAIAQ